MVVILVHARSSGQQNISTVSIGAANIYQRQHREYGCSVREVKNLGVAVCYVTFLQVDL